MDILSFKVNMAGPGSLDCSIPSKYDFISIYNAGSEYAIKVLLNGNKIYDLPSAFIGSLPIGALQQGGISNTITIQWTDISGGGLPDFLQLIYSEEQIVTSAISSLSAMSNYMQTVLYTAKGDILAGSAAAVPVHISVGSDGQVLTAHSAAAGGVDWEAVPADTTKIPLAIVTAKGDTIAASASGVPVHVVVGADGRVLTAHSAAAGGVDWEVVPPDATKIPLAAMTAKGDMLAATAAATPVAVPVGIDGNVLSADSGEPSGVKWTAAIGAGLGNVTGPAAAVNSHVALWDGVSGELLKDGGALCPVTVSVFSYGAVGDGSADDTSAFQAAINDLPHGGILLVGTHRLHGALTITKTITFRGASYINGNDTGADPLSRLYFDAGQAVCIDSTGTVVLEYLTINGTGVGIGIQITGNSIVLEHATIQGFVTAVTVAAGYYCKLNNSYIGYCDNDITFDNCYNINMVGMLLQATLTAIKLSNGSFLRMFGGSIERFQNAGISMLNASSIDLMGVYFEGVHLSDGLGKCITADTGSDVVLVGCHVYMTATAVFFAGNGATAIRLYSRNNKFIYPTDGSICDIYIMPIDAASYVDIAGDNWAATAGAGCVYVNTYGGMVGSYRIIIPANHPNYGNNGNTIPNQIVTTNVFTATPPLGTEIFAANNGAGSNPDPVGIHSHYGYAPYRAVYQGAGVWEKVGARVANQTNSTASTVALLLADFNTLLTAMRAAGLMV